MMTIVTSSSSSETIQPLEWKTLVEHLNDSSKVLEWIQSIRRWQELFQHHEDSVLTSWIFISTYSILQSNQRGQQTNSLIDCGKISLKYLLEKVLKTKTIDDQQCLLTLTTISSWCSGENQLTLNEMKDSIELIKRCDLPHLDRRSCRNGNDWIEILYSNSSSTKSKYFSECLTNYFHQIHGDEIIETLLIDLPRKSSLKIDFELIRRCLNLSLVDSSITSLSFRCFHRTFDETDETLCENVTKLLIDFAVKLRQSNCRDAFVTYLRQISKEIHRKLVEVSPTIEPYFHWIAFLLYSTNELLKISSKFDVDQLHIVEYFFDVLCQMSNRNETTIPDAPPLPVELPTTTNDETFDLDNLFSEKTPKILVQKARSIRCRTIFHRYLDETNEIDDFQQLEIFIEKLLFIDEVRRIFNRDEQIVKLVELNEHSKFVDRLLQFNVLDDEHENQLLNKFGIELDGQSTPTNFSIETLLILVKILLKRSNGDLINSFWSKFVEVLATNESSLEEIQLFLLLFHQLTLTEKKNHLNKLIRLIELNDGNVVYLLLLDYFMWNFYEMPDEFLERIQLVVTTKTLTKNFSSIFTKRKTLDNFAMKTISTSTNFYSFYLELIERLDFTRTNSSKNHQEILWRILTNLPVPKEYLEHVDEFQSSTHVLHSFHLENRRKDLVKKTDWSTFDLFVFELLFQTRSMPNEQIEEFFRIFLHEFESSFDIDPYERSLAKIPLTTTTKIEENPTKIPTDFDECFRFLLKRVFDENESNLRRSFLREILLILRPELTDKNLFIEIQINEHFRFLRDQIKFTSKENFNDDELNEKIFREIFQLLFDSNVPNAIVNDEIYLKLIQYIDEHFSLQLIQRCLTSHDLFDLLYLTSNEKHSIEVFYRMLTLFNRIFAQSNECSTMIKSLRRLANLTEEQLAKWFNKYLRSESTNEHREILETFIKYLIKKDERDRTTLIDEKSSSLLLKVLIDLAKNLFENLPNADGFGQLVQLLIILAGHGEGHGHRQLFPAAAFWLSSCSNRNVRCEGLVHLFSYVNEILSALKYFHRQHVEIVESDEDESTDDDDDDDVDQDDRNEEKPTKNNEMNEYDPTKLCTYTKTKKEYAHQHWYHCHTCQMTKTVGICQICANVCHRDHEISYAKFGSFFCDCGAKEDGSCQALVKRPSLPPVVVPSPPTQQQRRISTKKPTKKKKMTHRQRRLIKQLTNVHQDFEQLIHDERIPQITLKYFQTLQTSLRDHYQEIYQISNRFDLIDEYFRCQDRFEIVENDEMKSSLFTSATIHSQENAIENVKFTLANEHGQQIKQLLSTNSIRRQGLSLMLCQDPTKQNLVVSQEKGKQSMISIYQLNSLLKQTHPHLNTSTSIDNVNKKKFTVNKLNTFNVPFTILSIQPNQLNSDYLALTGLKDCHIMNIDANGRLKEATIVLQPNLDSTGNYIIRSQWIANQHQTQLALITADFIKIYDLAVDTISPIYFFILPTGKIRDCTFFYSQSSCFIFIIASNGYIYYEQLTESSSARNGSFYVTNTLDTKHELITETNNNGILLGGGVSVYYSTRLKLLFWSYVQGKNFMGIIDSDNIEKLRMIRSIDVKMTPTNGSKSTTNATTSTFHSLCAWTEIPSHPGLISTMTQMTNNPVLLMITPEQLRINEMKLQLKTTKIQDALTVRSDHHRTTLIILTDDGSLKFVSIDEEKTNYWLKKSYEKKTFYPLIDFDTIDDEQQMNIDDDSSQFVFQYPQSDNETDDQQETHPAKRRKTTLPILPPAVTSTTIHPSSQESNSTTIRFPVDFFETCQVLTDYEFGGRDLLDVYNVAQLKARLSNPNMFVANVRTTGFTLEIHNKDSDNMVMTGVRIHIGSYAMDKSPQYFEYLGRTIPIHSQQGPRWYDLCLTREESIQSEKKFNVFVGPSLDPNHITVIDDVQVYGKTKADFQWPEDLDAALAAGATSGTNSSNANHPTPMINNYLHSFRPTNDEKDLATLSLSDRLLAYAMQILTGSLVLYSNDPRRSNFIDEILPLASSMFHLSLPIPLQRYLRELVKEIFHSSTSSDTDYHEYCDRLHLTTLSQCLSKENYLDYFNDIQTFEYLLLSLLSVTRHRPHHLQRYLNITSSSSSVNESKDVRSKSASMEIFIPALVNIFFSLLDQRPMNRLLESIDHPLIEMKQIEKLLHILVDIYHSLALNEPTLCQHFVIDAYIRLLTYHDYQINFIIKNALHRCMQPKIQRLISKLSTGSDLNEQETTTTTNEKTFQAIPISAQIYPNEDQMRPRWTERTNLAPPPPPPPPPPATAASTTNDEAAMLQYALALSMATEENPGATIEYVDVDDETTNISLPSSSNSTAAEANATPTTGGASSLSGPIDHSDNNSLDEGDDGHVSESSSSTTNETSASATASTPVPVISIRSSAAAAPPSSSSSSNDSTTTLKLNLNDSIDSSIYEQRLNELKHLFVKKLLENLDEKLLHNRSLNGLNSIAYLQFLFTLTIEFASKTDEISRELIRFILERLLEQMTFIHQIDSDLIQRTAEHEIQLMLLRLFTVYVSFILKVRHDRDQYYHLSLTAAQQLEKSRVIDYCLNALRIVYKYLSKQPIDENLINDSTTTTTVTSSSPSSLMILMKITGQTNLPDLSPFFYKPYTKHHHRDVFESYPELLAEISTRLPYQMKKIFDSTSETRSSPLFSTEWQECLCEYYLLPQANFLKRQIRKLLMNLSGSRDKYRKLRDLHVLSTNFLEIRRIYDENRRIPSKQIPYSILMKLVDHLKSSQDISVQRSTNWQKFCKSDPSVLHFLIELIMMIDDSLVPFILNLLINAISISSNGASSATTTTTNRSLKTSKSVRSNDLDRTDDLTICSIVVQFSRMISTEIFEEFLRLFLFSHQQQSIRWLTHTFVLNLYLNSHQQFQDYLFDLFIQFWSSIRFYGVKAFQYIDLLGYMILKNKDDQRTSKFLPELESMLKDENQRLFSHPNASIYRRLSSIIDIEQNNGYYFETEPCLICNSSDIPYQQMKLQTIKADQRYTTQSHIIKLVQAYSIGKLQIKMSEMKRNKSVRTIRFFYNNRQVQSIVDLRNSLNCKWLLAKTIRLNSIQQTEVKIDFVIPIIACNLMIEYVDFFETPSSNLSTMNSDSTTTTLQCPRCNSAVAATPGICPNCGENVFQCHKCRSINYDERDPFLCNSCGYCKYCKFDFIFTAKQINFVEPIESDDDRTKTMTNISQLLEKTDKIYRQLFNQKPIIEYLLTKLTSDEQQSSTTLPSIPVETADPATATPPTPNNNGINRIVQQIAPKYQFECRQTYDELAKLIQKIIAARKELYSYDQRHSSSSSTKTTSQSNEQCYGCILSTISHCILLLRAFVSSSNRLKQSISSNSSLIDQLFLYNIRYTNQQIRHDVRLLFASLTRENLSLTESITTKIFDHLQQVDLSNSSSSLINYDLLLLHSLIQRSNQDDHDLCWESKLRLIIKIFLHSFKTNPTAQRFELITLPCLRMLLNLSKPIVSTTSTSSRFVPLNVDEFLSKRLNYQDFIHSTSSQSENEKKIDQSSWLEILLFSSQSATIRFLTCKLIQTLANDDQEKYFILKILLRYLHCICQEKTSRYSSEYVQLIKDFLTNEHTLKFLLNHDEQFHFIEHLASLIENEIQRIHLTDENSFSNSNLTFGYSIKSLTELLTLSLQQDQFKQKYKSILIAIVLNGYLSLKKLIIQRTKLIDEAQTKMLELLEQMTRGNEQETRQFMIICINTIEKFPPNDMQTPLFIFERLCNLIYPEETMQGNKEFFIVVEKDPNQEDFLQGRMMGNPYSSNDSAMGPLMRDIKNKICTDCELIALLEDDNGMELLVANKIINLGLTVRDVYKKVWVPYINSHQQQTGESNDHDPMHIVYRMRGLLGDATEDIIETFETKKSNGGDNGEDDPEEIYHLANILSEHNGLETMLKRLDSIREMSSGKALFEILLKLFEYAIKLKVNRQRLIDPKLRSISSMLDKLNLLLKTEIEEQGRDQILLSLTERLLSLMDVLFHEASTTLSQEKYNEFSVSCQGDIEQLRSLLNYIKLPFVKTHPSLMQALIHLLPYLSFANKEKMQTLIDYFKSYLEFDRFDAEQTLVSNNNDNDHQLHLDCFCEICKHLDKKSIYGKEFRDFLNQSDGIIDQCIAYIEKNAPPVKTYLGMQDQDSWKEFLNKSSLSYILRLLTGLSSGHQEIQLKVGLTLIPILHKIERLTTAGKIGVLAEDLLHTLTENEQVATKIDEVRNQTRAEKKRLAQEARDRTMRELNLNKSTRPKPSIDPIPAPPVELIDETGHVCCICREGYQYFPNKVLAIYTFTKKVDIEPYEGKTRKTSGYTTVTHFNIIHIDCHTSAVKQARSRDEWESAMLQNANTRCNGLLPLWGPDVPEAQFTTALARYDSNIVEGTGIRETSATLSIHDMKLLLLRFAELQSFSEDTGGGGRESNIRLIPYQMHAILYVLNASRQIEREEKLLQNFLTRPDPTINEAFEVDGPYFMTTLALILMKPSDWEKYRRIFLQRLLVTTHVRAVNTPNDRTRLTSKTLKPFATYRTALIFFGLIHAFFIHLFKPMTESTSTTTASLLYHQQLAHFLRHHDAQLMDACTRILKHFEQDLLTQQTFDGFFHLLGFDSLSEQSVQDMINPL